MIIAAVAALCALGAVSGESIVSLVTQLQLSKEQQQAADPAILGTSANATGEAIQRALAQLTSFTAEHMGSESHDALGKVLGGVEILKLVEFRTNQLLQDAEDTDQQQAADPAILLGISANATREAIQRALAQIQQLASSSAERIEKLAQRSDPKALECVLPAIEVLKVLYPGAQVTDEQQQAANPAILGILNLTQRSKRDAMEKIMSGDEILKLVVFRTRQLLACIEETDEGNN